MWLSDDPVAPRFGRLWWMERLAGLIITWERLVAALYPAIVIAVFFLALAFLDVLPRLGMIGHWAVIVLAALGLLAALVHAVRRFTGPDLDLSRRRLERDSRIAHRPLSTARDRLATGADDDGAIGLWRAHQERARAALARLRLRLPDPGLNTLDQRAIGPLGGLLMVVGMLLGWGEWQARLADAFSPGVVMAAVPSQLDVWIKPPAYTRLAPLFLDPAETAVLEVPTGSLVEARLSGRGGAPDLAINGGVVPFDEVPGHGFEAIQTLTGGSEIAVSRGVSVLARWPVTVVPDAAPTVTFDERPGLVREGTFTIAYTAEDDYGLDTVGLTITATDDVIGLPDLDPIMVDLPLSGVRPQISGSTSFHNFTAHPWAGLPVHVELAATDDAEQTGRSERLTMTLPERVFNHPVAQAIIAQRKRIMLDGLDQRRDIAINLLAIASRTGTYSGDPVVFLGLRFAAVRLGRTEPDQAGVGEVVNLLWELALRLEDGGLSLARRDLRDAIEELRQALDDPDATDAELDRLTQAVEQAMQRLMQEMAQDLAERLARGEDVPELPPGFENRMMEVQDLSEMMEQIRNMSELGSREAAQQMLSQLQQMMENLSSLSSMEMTPQQQQAMEAIGDLQDLIQDQQQLMDETFRQSQEGQDNPLDNSPLSGLPFNIQEQLRRFREQQEQLSRRQQQSGQQQQGQQPGEGDQEGSGPRAADQEALRRRLGDIMRQLGEATGQDIPEQLGRAGQSMRQAEGELGAGQPGSALPHQGEALEQLQEGMSNMAQQMMQQMGIGMGVMMMPGRGERRGPNQNRPGEDPFGRNPGDNGEIDRTDFELPSEMEFRRVREIMDELRRRAGERSRPEIELDYIDRLLRQF